MGCFRKKPVSFNYALLVMLFVFSTIMIPVLIWNTKIYALFLVSLLIAILFCLPIGIGYQELQDGMIHNCAKAIPAMIIILSVGALVGTWNAAGTIPTIICFGIQTISPQIFPATAFLFCLVTSFMTGTSWGTFGTAGLALAGIGLGLNINPALTAGAVCSGAFFGDVVSPMSNSPNIAAAVSGVDLFEGIRHQIKVTVPSALICVILYLILGLQYQDGEINNAFIINVVQIINRNFKTDIISLLPAILVVTLLLFKVPSIPAILGSSLVAGGIACFYQGSTIRDCISYFWSGYTIESGVKFVDELLSCGGAMSMAETALMFLLAFGLFGILNTAGVVEAVMEPVTRRLRSKLSLILATLFMSIIGTIIGASMNFAYIFAGSIMAPVFERNSIQKVDLMRALGVGCTAMAVLVPWSLSTTVALPFLNVSALDLIPYNFFLSVSPVVLIIWTIIEKDAKLLSEKSKSTSERAN